MAEQIKNLGKVFVTPEGEWDINKEYDRLALVNAIDTDTNELMSYISKQQVPAGSITLNNKQYWQRFTNNVNFENISLKDDGWIYIGDVPVYQVTLQDSIGQAVVDKIEDGLTQKIMTVVTNYMSDTISELKRYMSGVVTDFVGAITNQITRLIIDGIKVNNINSGSINQKITGKLNTEIEGVVYENIKGTVENNIKGNIDTKQSGEILNKLTGSVNAGVVVEGNIDNNLDGKVKVEHEGVVNNINSGSINNNVSLSGGIKVDDGEPEPPKTYTLSVVTNPVTAKVTLDGVETKSKTFIKGSTVLVVISQDGYVTQTRTVSNLSEDTTINVTLVEKTPSYFFGVQPLNNHISANGGTIDCLVVSLKDSVLQNYTYTTEGDIFESVNKLESNLIINLKSNTSESSKIGKVILTQNESNKQLTVIVNQAGKDVTNNYTFELNKTSINSDYNAKTEQVTVTSKKNDTYLDYNIGATPTWCTVTKDSNHNLNIQLTENTATSNRTGTIELIQNETSSIKLITITQNGTVEDEFIFNAQLTPISANGNGGTFNKKITSTKNGVAIDFSIGETPNWVTATKTDDGINLEIPVNYTEQLKTCTIVLTQNESNNNISIIINQEASTIEFSLNPTSINIDNNEHTVTFTEDNKIIIDNDETISAPIITSKVNNSAVKYLTPRTKETYDWIIGEVGNNVKFTISANQSTYSRTAYIKLQQANTGNIIELAINQEGRTVYTYTLEADPTDIVFSANGGTEVIGVTSTKNGNPQSTSITSKPDWVTITKVSSGYNISIGNNNTSNEREGIIVITQLDSNKTINIFVTQHGSNFPDPDDPDTPQEYDINGELEVTDSTNTEARIIDIEELENTEIVVNHIQNQDSPIISVDSIAVNNTETKASFEITNVSSDDGDVSWIEPVVSGDSITISCNRDYDSFDAVLSTKLHIYESMTSNTIIKSIPFTIKYAHSLSV